MQGERLVEPRFDGTRGIPYARGMNDASPLLSRPPSLRLPKLRSMALALVGLTLLASCAEMSSTSGSTTSGSADTAAGDSTAQGDEATQPPAFVDELVAEANECQAAGDWVRAQFVLDGDTIVVDDGSWSKVRLLGVAAPEISHPPKQAECYGAASFSLAKKWLQIEQPNVTNVYVCMLKDSKADNKDAFDRLLRYVYLRDSAGTPVQLNARLIRMGAARVYREYSKGLRFETALIARENAAKAEKLGGWSQCNWSPLK